MRIFKNHWSIVVLMVAGLVAGGAATVNAANHWSGARDTEAPVLSIVGVPERTDEPFTATFVFNERVLGFSRNDVAAVNARMSDFSGIGKNYKVTVKPNGRGDVRIVVIAHSAADMAGNTGPIADVSKTVSVPAAEGSASRSTGELLESVEKRRKGIEGDARSGLDTATRTRQDAAEGVRGEVPDLLIEPPRITKEDEEWVFEQQDILQPQQKGRQPCTP